MPSPLPVAERIRSTGAEAVNEVRRARPLLGTVVEIHVAAAHPIGYLHAAVDGAFASVERVHRLMSCHDPDSELSRVNRRAATSEQLVDSETYTVIEAALRIAAVSEGAFDPCVGDRLEQWGYLPRVTTGSCTTLPGTWPDVELPGPCRVRFRRPVRLDLGGIAKGYAVDRATTELLAAGIDNTLVNAGGDLRIAGHWSQDVLLRDPRPPHQSSQQLTLRNSVLATSAAYYSRRRLPWGEVSALINPRCGTPYIENGTASVRAADCMSADALTKVVLFAPPRVAECALAACNAQAFVQARAEAAD